MEVNTTCKLRGGCVCYNQDDNIIETLVYFIFVIWCFIIIISMKIKKD